MRLLRYLNLRCVLMISGITAISLVVNADEAMPDGLVSAITGKEATSWAGLQRYGLKIGSWATTGINYNIDNAPDNSNGPMSMTDRSNEFNLYQLDLFIEKVVTKSKNWDVGGRFDYMFGTDTRYTQATGNWDTHLMNPNSYYNMALPQTYVEVFAPVGNGLNGKFGHFYTIIGYESVPSALNFFSSHTYSFKSSPFTTSGALFNYTINDQWNVNLGAITGPDNFNRDIGAWSQMSGINWANTKTGTALSFSIMQGDVYQNRPSNLVYYSAIFQQTLGKWHYVFQHDRGTQDHAANNQTAVWYSVVHYLTYQFNDIFGLGVRSEWFRDQNGFR